MNAAASIGSLVQPNPVENSIVLPASPPHDRENCAGFSDTIMRFIPHPRCGDIVAKLWRQGLKDKGRAKRHIKGKTNGPRAKAHARRHGD
ncbi:hypothetical protein [Bradyrhizobium sp. UFLA05-112]